jgi:hypothetical protein
MLVKTELNEAAIVLLPMPKEMLSVTKVGSQTKVRINSSSLDIIQSCLRKAQYSLLEGWQSKEESSATLFGSAVHKCLEVFYSGTPEQRHVPHLEKLELMSYGNVIPNEEIDLCLRSFRAFLNVAKALSPLPESDKRSLQNGAWLMWCYFKSYKDDPYVCFEDSYGPFLERKFSLIIHQDDSLMIEIFGTIDFAFRDIHSGEIILGDHKTTSQLNWGGSSYFDREKPNHQYTCYALGAFECYSINSRNFMVNVVEVKARPKTEKAKGPNFPRQITTRTEEDFAEFKATMIYYVKEYLRAVDSKYFPLGPVGSCNAYGSCNYRQVCSAPKALRHNVLNAKFNQRQGNNNETK